MSRPKNQVPTQRLVVSSTPQLNEYLENLVQLGIFGKSPPDVAYLLLCRAIEGLIKDGILSLPALGQKQPSTKTTKLG
jgi:hypothetical protein